MISYIYLLATEYKGRTINKLGWSGYPPSQYRVEQIDESIKKYDVRLVKYWRVLGQKKHEQRLHRKFGDKRFTFEGSGRTEWFRFNWVELAIIDIDLSICQWYALNRPQILTFTILSILYLVFETYYYFA